ncbi:MAG: hypothetical protein ISR39_15405 [Akkermansiaceae bacterium]|nr:hypothetical protein [Akkermansiaceae bacterium]
MKIEQQNGVPASEVLSAFFNLIEKEADRDGEISVQKMRELRREEREYVACSGGGNARDLARSYHRRMLLGVGMVENSTLPKYLIFFSATLPAHEIAEMACGVACESGRLLEIQELLAQYEWNDASNDGEGACLEQEGEMVLSRISDTILTHVLRSYGHDDFVSCYEGNRGAYHRRCEVGRNLIVSRGSRNAIEPSVA